MSRLVRNSRKKKKRTYTRKATLLRWIFSCKKLIPLKNRRPLRRVGSKMDRNIIKFRQCLSQTDHNLWDHSFQENKKRAEKKEKQIILIILIISRPRARGFVFVSKGEQNSGNPSLASLQLVPPLANLRKLGKVNFASGAHFSLHPLCFLLHKVHVC